MMMRKSFTRTEPTAADRKPIFGERFKTTPCKSFGARGECPYEWRCMFAHGDNELRTKQQNIADGLKTEEDVKALQRRLAEEAGLLAKSSPSEATIGASSVAAHPPMNRKAVTKQSPSGSESWSQPSIAASAVSAQSTPLKGGLGRAAADESNDDVASVDEEEFALGELAYLGVGSLPDRQLSSAATHDGSLVMSALAEAANDDFVSPLAKAMIVGRKCESAVASPSKLVVSV